MLIVAGVLLLFVGGVVLLAFSEQVFQRDRRRE